MSFDNYSAESAENAERSKLYYSYMHKQSEILSDSMIINTLMNNSEDMIFFKDSNSKFILNNRAHAERFGIQDPHDLLGKCDADFYPKDFADKLFQDEQEIIRTGNPLINQMEWEMMSSSKFLTLSSSKYPLYDREGKVIGIWGISRDMTKLALAEAELEAANEKLQELSLVDELSGLYNQRNFYASLDSTIKLFTRRRAESLPAEFCLVLMDIDHFKNVNDTYGHVVGDAAIRFVSGLMMAHTRTSDTAFRYGGDEYAFILQDTDLAGGRELSERLRAVVEQNPFLTDGIRIDLTISLGVVSFDNETSCSEFVQKADAQLYQAKEEGRNRVC